MNLVDRQAKPAQTALLDIARQNPVITLQEAQRLSLPRRHDVRASDVDLKRLGAVLAVAYEREFHDFAELLLLEKARAADASNACRSLRKSFMERRRGFRIRRASRSRSAARTAIRFQFR